MNRRTTQLRMLVIVALVITCAAARLRAAAAVLSVRASGTLAKGAMAENARIHPNRDYAFTRVPSFLRGAEFTSHLHKGPATVHCTAKEPGTVYLCLQEPATPATLKLADTWRPCGKIDTVINGNNKKNFPWGIWWTHVKPGWSVTIAPPDRWGAVLAARKIDGLKPATRGGHPSGALDEYALLKRDIANRRWFDRIASQTLRPEALILESDRDPLDVVLRRTAALAGNLTARTDAPDLAGELDELKQLQKACAEAPVDAAPARRALFETAVKLRRRIAFANPLLNFDQIAFLKHHRSRFNHMCYQYHGFFAVQGGGVCVLRDAFDAKPTVRDVLAEATVANGRLAGKKLTGGSFLSLDVSYDAKTMLFAWTRGAPPTNKWTPQNTFHIFKVNADPGAPGGLTQLTDGKCNEFDPCFLPNGRIAFISERRGGYLRCGGLAAPTNALYGMQADGSDIIRLSYHETHEWHPSVDNNGMIVYTRWDYVDRDSDIAHHIWLCYPDGRDPRSFHGNYPARRELRPWMEMAIRAIPNSPKYIAVATPHHGQNYGSMILIDQRLPDDRAMSQVKRITPEVPLPESEGGRRGLRATEVYGQPWPLSEDFYLCVYDPRGRNYGLYLVDSFGNRELLYRDASIACLDPIPLRPRPVPPVIPIQTTQAAAEKPTGPHPPASIAVMDIYDADFKWPVGTKITALRIVQVFPKATPVVAKPNIGMGDQSLARGVLGTVPVEPDGSVYFEAPVGMPIYFQALDAAGLAVQSMRSDTFVHPGEKLVCQGCHEPKNRTGEAVKTRNPMALRRPPSKIKPDVSGSNPLSFPRLVQGVLDRRCTPCHLKQKKAPSLSGTKFGKYGWSQSFQTLARYGWARHGGNGALHRKNDNLSYSVAGKIGANASKLLPMLTTGSHKDRIKNLTAEELHRITLWLDCNSNFYGAYLNLEQQARGELVLPSLQ